MKIIPAINAETFEEVKRRIDLLKDLTKEFHIDTADKKLTDIEIWRNPKELDLLDEDLKLDIHLMLQMKPQEVLKWNNRRIKRLILHLEGTNLPDALLRIARRTKKEIYIAWPPGFELGFIEKYFNFVDGVLILGVMPGRSGQEIFPDTFYLPQRIKAKLTKKQKIMIDGGINEDNIKRIIELKPDFIIMGSAIYGKENPREEFLRFKKLVD